MDTQQLPEDDELIYEIPVSFEIIEEFQALAIKANQEYWRKLQTKAVYQFCKSVFNNGNGLSKLATETRKHYLQLIRVDTEAAYAEMQTLLQTLGKLVVSSHLPDPLVFSKIVPCSEDQKRLLQELLNNLEPGHGSTD